MPTNVYLKTLKNNDSYFNKVDLLHTEATEDILKYSMEVNESTEALDKNLYFKVGPKYLSPKGARLIESHLGWVVYDGIKKSWHIHETPMIEIHN